MTPTITSDSSSDKMTLTPGHLATFNGDNQVQIQAGPAGACFTVSLLK